MTPENGATLDSGRTPALVSVIVPSFNHEPYVLETLRSVAGQTHRPLEVIVIDDGSKDASRAVIENWANENRDRFTRLVTRFRPNLGLLTTLNEGVLIADGEFILIIASDDVLEPACVEHLERCLVDAGPSFAVASGDSSFIDSKSRRVYVEPDGRVVLEPTATTAATFIGRSRPALDPRTFGTHRSFLDGNYVPNANLIRRAAMLEVGLYGGSARIEDFDMWLKLSRRYRFAWTPETLSRYRLHGTNQAVVHSDAMVRDTIHLILREAKYLLPGESLADVYRGAARFVPGFRSKAFRDLITHENAELGRAVDAVASRLVRRQATRAFRAGKRLAKALLRA